MIFYESPFRIKKTLEQFTEIFGHQRKVSVSREISKLHEETIRGNLKQVVESLKDRTLKGEMVIVVEGLND